MRQGNKVWDEIWTGHVCVFITFFVIVVTEFWGGEKHLEHFDGR